MSYFEDKNIIEDTTVAEKHNPCVYIWRRGNEYLYIGSTVELSSRMHSHHVIGILDPVTREDKLYITYFKSIKDAETNEKELISLHQPKFNTQYTEKAKTRRHFGKRRPRPFPYRYTKSGKRVDLSKEEFDRIIDEWEHE